MSIVFDKMNQLLDLFKYTSISYYKENRNYEEIASSQYLFEDISFEIVVYLNRENICNMQNNIGKIEFILQEARTELLSNICNIESFENKQYLLNSVKQDFIKIYSDYNEYVKNLYSKELIIRTKGEISLVDYMSIYRSYIISLSELGQAWAIIINNIEHQYKYDLSDFIIPKGRFIRKSHIFDILYFDEENERIELIRKCLEKYITCDFASFKAFYKDEQLGDNPRIVWKHFGNRLDHLEEPNIALLTKFVIIGKDLDIEKNIFPIYKKIIETYFMLPNEKGIEIKNNYLYKIIDKKTGKLKSDNHCENFVNYFSVEA